MTKGERKALRGGDRSQEEDIVQEGEEGGVGE